MASKQVTIQVQGKMVDLGQPRLYHWVCNMPGVYPIMPYRGWKTTRGARGAATRWAKAYGLKAKIKVLGERGDEDG